MNSTPCQTNQTQQTKQTQTDRSGRVLIAIACTLAAIAVALGAIGAHLLEKWLADNFDDAPRRLELWETATRYLMYHALGILAVGMVTLLTNRQKVLVVCLMLLGIVLFSGCLYGYVLTNLKTLVHIVPVGGMAMITSWLSFGWLAFKSRIQRSRD